MSTKKGLFARQAESVANKKKYLPFKPSTALMTDPAYFQGHIYEAACPITFMQNGDAQFVDEDPDDPVVKERKQSFRPKKGEENMINWYILFRTIFTPTDVGTSLPASTNLIAIDNCTFALFNVYENVTGRGRGASRIRQQTINDYGVKFLKICVPTASLQAIKDGLMRATRRLCDYESGTFTQDGKGVWISSNFVDKSSGGVEITQCSFKLVRGRLVPKTIDDVDDETIRELEDAGSYPLEASYSPKLLLEQCGDLVMGTAFFKPTLTLKLNSNDKPNTVGKGGAGPMWKINLKLDSAYADMYRDLYDDADGIAPHKFPESVSGPVVPVTKLKFKDEMASYLMSTGAMGPIGGAPAKFNPLSPSKRAAAAGGGESDGLPTPGLGGSPVRSPRKGDDHHTGTPGSKRDDPDEMHPSALSSFTNVH